VGRLGRLFGEVIITYHKGYTMILKKITTLGLATSVALAAVSFASAKGPDRPTIPELPELNLSQIIETFREAQQELVQERRALAEGLRDETVEERRQAIEAYQAANADRVALHKALAEQIRDLAKEIRLEIDRPEVDRQQINEAERPAVNEGGQELIQEFRLVRAALIQERLTVLATLRDASDEDRAAALAGLRQQNADLAAQQRAMAQEIREAVQENREGRRNK
jgi:uncharacterized protein